MKLINIKKYLIIFIVIVIVLFIGINLKGFMKVILPIAYQNEIKLYASNYDINPNLVSAVIKVESNYEKTAKSHKDARGLMQILPSTGQWVNSQIKLDNYDTDMLYDIETNINIGCWYLSYLFKQFHNVETVLAAYNAGNGNVSSWLSNEEYSTDGQTLDVIPFAETNTYVKKVMFYFYIYEKIYN